jgi:HNH endonuclease
MCDTTRGLEVHHIVHWAHGGRTDTDNLVTLCRRHHRDHHHGIFHITGNPDQPDTPHSGLTFTNHHGTPITTPAPTPPNRTPPPRPNQPYHHPTGSRLDPWNVHYHRQPRPHCPHCPPRGLTARPSSDRVVPIRGAGNGDALAPRIPVRVRSHHRSPPAFIDGPGLQFRLGGVTGVPRKQPTV